MNTFVTVSLVLALVGMAWRLWSVHRSKSALQQKLSVVESSVALLESRLIASLDRLSAVERQQKEELSQDQLDFRDKLQAQYSLLFQKIQDDFKAEVKAVKAEAVGTVSKAKVDFDKLLKTEFEKACEKIHFDEIEYKKTITKKRKEYSRKNSHKAKPQKIWRSITDE